MTSKRAPYGLLAGLGLLCAILGIVFWGSGGGGGSKPAPDDVHALAGSGESAPRANAAEAASPSAEVAAAARVAAKPSEGSLPAAYVRALSGIHGRVVEPGGEPAPGQPVELLGGLLEFLALDIDRLLFDPDSFSLSISQQRQVTAADGTFRFEKVDPRGYYVVGVNLGRGRPQLRFVDQAPQPGEAADLGDIVLDPPLALTGRVVDEAGRGIANARVRATSIPDVAFQSGLAYLQPGTAMIFRTGPQRNAPKLFWKLPKWTDVLFEKFPAPATTTAADGTFRLEGAPAGPLTLLVDGPPIAPLHKPLPSSRGPEKDLGEVVVTRGEEVPLLVVDENDAPVAGAEVMVGIPSPLAQDYVAFLQKPLTCDGVGAATARAIAVPKIFLVARAPGQHDWTVGELTEASGDGVRIQIPAPRSLQVNVKDAAGKPLDAAIAVQKSWELAAFPQVEPPLKVTPERLEPGRYRVRGLVKGKYTVYARADGFTIGKETVAIEQTGEPECSITLDPEFLMEVTVLGKEDGKPAPLERATVFGAPERKLESLGFMALGNAQTNRQGVARVRALGTGPYRIVATHPAYAVGWVKTELPGPRSATIELLRGGTVEGQVVRGGAIPEKPMMVVCFPDGVEIPQLPRTSITALEGRFRFSHLYPGKYKVVATPRFFGEGLTNLNPLEFMRASSDNAEQSFEIRDEQVTQVLLDLAKGGRPDSPDDGFLRGAAIVDGAAAEGDYVMAMGPEFVRPAPVDATGSFDLGRVKPGDYAVSLTRRSGSGGLGSAFASRSVTVKDGESVFVEFNVRTARLRGIVKDASGKPVGGARIRARLKSESAGFGSPRLFADETGQFVLEGIAAGPYVVSASMEDAASYEVDVDVTPASDARVELVLRTTVTFEGTFEAPGIPEESRFAMIQFAPAERAEATPGRVPWDTNAANVDFPKRTFRARRLHPGRYQATLTVFASRGRRLEFEPLSVEVPPSGSTSEVLRFKAMPKADPGK